LFGLRGVLLDKGGTPLIYLENMITLLYNTADQHFYVTLREGANALGTHYLMNLKDRSTSNELNLILDVVADNVRYSKIRISTNINDATSGNLILTEGARYTYKIYAQNSANNLDPTSADVVALVEYGNLDMTGGDEVLTNYTEPTNIYTQYEE